MQPGHIFPLMARPGGVITRAGHTEAGCDLADLELETLKSVSPTIEHDVYEILTVEGSVASRNTWGGTAPEQVKAQIAVARQRLEKS